MLYRVLDGKKCYNKSVRAVLSTPPDVAQPSKRRAFIILAPCQQFETVALSGRAVKRCKKCLENKPLDAFGKSNRHSCGLLSICKSCRNEVTRRWKVDNAEAVKASNKRYVEKNLEKLREAARNWHKQNPELSKARNKTYREANLEKERAKVQAWTLKHSERRKLQIKTWAVNNPERRATSERKRRAAKVLSTGTHTASDINFLLHQQKNRCHWCSKKLVNYHVDHVIPLSKGGSNDVSNLVISCPKCNLSKHTKMPWEFNGRLF